MSVPEIMEQVESVAEGAQHVVLTGGEPMLPREIEALCQTLHDRSMHLTIETAGTIFRDLKCNLMSISPKFSNSDPNVERAGEWRRKHQQQRNRPEVVRELIAQYPFQLKFVVDAPQDLDEIREYLAQLELTSFSRVLLMPQGVEHEELEEKAKWLVPLCESNGFTFCARRHIEWYGNKRGT